MTLTEEHIHNRIYFAEGRFLLDPRNPLRIRGLTNPAASALHTAHDALRFRLQQENEATPNRYFDFIPDGTHDASPTFLSLASATEKAQNSTRFATATATEPALEFGLGATVRIAGDPETLRQDAIAPQLIDAYNDGNEIRGLIIQHDNRGGGTWRVETTDHGTWWIRTTNLEIIA
ncbi:MAG: hypothetical protein WB239_17975 [Acidimicrobiia bacterium]